jgi:hypothetical protein
METLTEPNYSAEKRISLSKAKPPEIPVSAGCLYHSSGEQLVWYAEAL